MARSKPSRSQTTRGTLRIGDQWNAINIIARSQTHPLKAVCELTENAIDANAHTVQILRRRTKNGIYLEVVDDGDGVSLNDAGTPDFARIATHICDSMKRQLDQRERQGVHGEFGIGLLSFWSLGEQLRVISAGRDGRLRQMQLERGGKSYNVQPLRGQLPMGGTRVIVGPLLNSTRNIVTGEKLARYLSAELRDRIRKTGAQVRITDRIARKDLLVMPREFEGTRIDVAPKVRTAHGEVLVELYFREGSDGQEGGVAVCKDGTRVLKNITDLEHFQHAPWDTGRVEGVLDYAAFELAPGTRHGIVPDEEMDAFVDAVQTLEPRILNAIQEREQAESDRASRDILRQVHRAFVNALRELPSDEYLFFDVPEINRRLRDGSVEEAGHNGATGLPVTARVPVDDDDADGDGGSQKLLRLEPGPLTSVRITPRHPRREPGEECTLTAAAKDEHGVPIREQVEYAWHVTEGDGRLVKTDGNTCVLTSNTVGKIVVQVRASQAENSAVDQVPVKFLPNTADGTRDKSKGLPSYRLEPKHGEPWRSCYDAKENQIIINSAHRDFLASKATRAKHRRYVGKLYAKEVVLVNFGHESAGEVMERLIELTLRIEDVL